MSDLVGLCSMCRRPDAMHTCSLCGQLVCDRCFDRKHQVCVWCHRRPPDTVIP